MLITMIVLTRNQWEKLSKEELIYELLTVNSIQEELANLTSRFKEFLEMCVCNLKKLQKTIKKLHQAFFKTDWNTTKKFSGLVAIPSYGNDWNKSSN